MEWLRRGLRLVASIAIVCAIEVIEFRLHGLRNTTITYSLLLAILFFAVRWGRLETIAASVVGAFGFLKYFQEPVGSLKASDPESYVAVGSFLITAIVVSQTALAARRRAAEAVESRRETERLYELGQALLASDSPQTTAWIATYHITRIFGGTGAAFYLHQSGEFQRAGDTGCFTDEALRSAALKRTVVNDRLKAFVLTPIVVGDDELVGSLGVCGTAVSDTALKSIASLLAVVLERVRAGEKLILANHELAQRHQQVEQQKQVSESLLLNILPAEVAEELRAKGMVSPKYFEDVTILFTDFVGFTLATEKLAAEELVETLHDYFTAFDRIVTRYRLEKMKTIGDSYMCLSGLPVRNPAHPVDTVMAAFEMVQAVRERTRPDRPGWKVRIGIHTGPVIAGVVGINKFAFDIWGDTVNYSSRMESSGEANRINLSERTYSRVKDFFDCESRGKVLTKEKREHEMFFANGILPVLANGQGVDTVPPAFLRRYNVYFQKDPPAFPGFLTQQIESVSLAALKETVAS
jgi:class 3 adenylate cyclase